MFVLNFIRLLTFPMILLLLLVSLFGCGDKRDTEDASVQFLANKVFSFTVVPEEFVDLFNLPIREFSITFDEPSGNTVAFVLESNATDGTVIYRGQVTVNPVSVCFFDFDEGQDAPQDRTFTCEKVEREIYNGKIEGLGLTDDIAPDATGENVDSIDITEVLQEYPTALVEQQT